MPLGVASYELSLFVQIAAAIVGLASRYAEELLAPLDSAGAAFRAPQMRKLAGVKH